MEKGLAMCLESSIPMKYWVYAFKSIIFFINMLPFMSLSNKSTFQIFYNKNRDYTFMKDFGSLCFPCFSPYTYHKLESQSSLCVIFGYAPQQHGYLCFDLTTQTLH